MSISFKHFLKAAESASEDGIDAKIRSLVDASGLVLFFEKKGDVYGTDEQGRIVFAQLKSKGKDQEHTDHWRDEATFMAKNLSNVLRGGGIDSVLSKQDLKQIKVIDNDKAFQMLSKQASKTDQRTDSIEIVTLKK